MTYSDVKSQNTENLINFLQAAKNACRYRLKMKQREKKPVHFFIHCTPALRLVKVESNVVDAKNEFTNRV